MADFGVLPEGFVLKRLADILSDMKDSLSAVTDPVSGESLTPDLLDEDDPLIQVVDSFSDALAKCWEELQNAYNQFDPIKASGAGLSGTVQLNGLRRRAGTPSRVTVTCTGTVGLSVVAGKRISTVQGTPIFELPAFQIGGGGTVSVVASCIEDGPNEASAGTLVKILTPVSGWVSVTNALDAVVGTNEETDAELRDRQQLSTAHTAQTIIEAIAAGIGNLDGVTFVKVYHNNELTEDDNGIPAKCIAPIVQGGDEDEIADVMFEKLAAGGADTYGDVEIGIEDAQGIIYPMRFSRPSEVLVFVIVNVEVVNSVAWPSNGVDLIKSSIISWAQLGGSAIGVYNEYDQDGYSPGQSVYASELFIPCYGVPGIKVESILIGVADDSAGEDSSAATEDEIIIAWNEIAKFVSENIQVNLL